MRYNGDNLAATKVKLTPEQVARLDEVSVVPLASAHSLASDVGWWQRIAGGKLDQFDLPAMPVA
jgi:hypothetical protein